MRLKLLISLIVTLFLQTLSPAGLKSQLIKIRLEKLEGISEATWQTLGDDAAVFLNDTFPEQLAKIGPLGKINMQAIGDRIILKNDSSDIGEYPSVSFWINDKNPRFHLITGKGRRSMLTYPGKLTVSARGGRLIFTDEVWVDEYVRGVIYAEAGHHKSLEFFKVQALSARTYALRNRGRHGREGFDLCDQTHCQAFAGIPSNIPLIDKAVKLTEGEMIVFHDSVLIDAVFSANCGGFTANSEDVWINEVDYLRAVPDYDYCEGFGNHAWHLTVPKGKFLEKIGGYHDVEVRTFRVIPDESGRVSQLIINDDNALSISGTELRRIFNLKSAKFHVFESGSGMLMIEGSGFGHGVGLCQDGAFHLSEMGLDYDKIIKHYYSGVSISKRNTQ